MRKKILISCMAILLFLVFINSSKLRNIESMHKVNSLNKGMSIGEIKEILGEPLSDIGSGLNVYTYRIGYYGLILSFSNEKLLSAVLQNNDGTIHKQIIK